MEQGRGDQGWRCAILFSQGRALNRMLDLGDSAVAVMGPALAPQKLEQHFHRVHAILHFTAILVSASLIMACRDRFGQSMTTRTRRSVVLVRLVSAKAARNIAAVASSGTATRTSRQGFR
jgi:hypothetical protein